MRKHFLKVYQIYFEPTQLGDLDYEPFHNEKCTPYFENSVIKDLIERDSHLDCEYFGVVSYQLKSKLGFTKDKWKSIPNIANHSINRFTSQSFEDELRKGMPDVMSFQRHISHDPILMADRFHPNFSKYFKEIMHKVGFDWKPTVFANIFYCNFFAAKSHVYDKYAKEMLIPAMKIMDGMPELMGNSGYPKPLPLNLKAEWGIAHYPYHAFICERMFSYWAHLNYLKCLHY